MLNMAGAVLERVAERGTAGFGLTVDAFSVRRGDRVGLIGPSGSGKSTMLELIALLSWPTRLMRFLVDGQDVTAALKSRRLDEITRLRSRNIAYAPQNGGLLPYMSVRENAQLAARLAGRSARQSQEIMEAMAERLGIGGLLSKPPAQLSGGERHRASLLRMSCSGAGLMIADEPTAALDRATADAALAALVDVAQATDAALVCASHDVDLLKRLGFRLAIIEVTSDPKTGARHARLNWS